MPRTSKADAPVSLGEPAIEGRYAPGPGRGMDDVTRALSEKLVVFLDGAMAIAGGWNVSLAGSSCNSSE